MIKKSTSYISLCLLLIWSFAQGVDAWHHMHEVHEETCEVGSTHYCEPHAEVELCELCTVVHGNALQQFNSYRINKIEMSVSNDTDTQSGFITRYISTQLSRGPPSKV